MGGTAPSAQVASSRSTPSDLFIATALRGAQDFDEIRMRLNAIRTVAVQHSDVYRQEAQAAAVRLRITLLLGMIVTSVLSLGTLSFLASNIARRVQRVTWAATRIAHSDNSVPVLPVRSSTLVMPLVVPLDSSRLALMQTQALQAIERSGTRRLILHITGVPIIDTQVALGLTQLMQAARLLGVNVDIVGIRPEVAQAIVGLGLEVRDVRTFSNLQAALDRVLV